MDLKEPGVLFSTAVPLEISVPCSSQLLILVFYSCLAFSIPVILDNKSPSVEHGEWQIIRVFS